MITIERYKDRYYALYEDGVLLAVCCYRKGAVTVKGRLEALQEHVRELEPARTRQLPLPLGHHA